MGNRAQLNDSFGEVAALAPASSCLLWGVAASEERSSSNWSAGSEADSVGVVRVATLGGVFGSDGGNPNAKL